MHPSSFKRAGSLYLSQVKVVLLHVNKVIADEQLHSFHVVLVLISAFDQAPEELNCF